MFLEKYYVYMLWEVFRVFPERSYEKHTEMREVINEWISDFASNMFCQFPGNEFDSFMIKLLEHTLDEKFLLQLKDTMLAKFNVRDAQEF